MCFIPFVATRTPPTLVPEFPPTPGTALHPLHPQYAAVADKFTLPHCAALKIAHGCGCWLRYMDYPDPKEMEYMVQLKVSDPGYNPADKQVNHDALADYLTEHFRQDEFVEFFGFFSGDAGQPARARQQIPVSAIRHPHFHFHGGTIYRLVFE
jgi:hypothetical protein